MVTLARGSNIAVVISIEPLGLLYTPSLIKTAFPYCFAVFSVYQYSISILNRFESILCKFQFSKKYVRDAFVHIYITQIYVAHKESRYVCKAS